MRIFIAGDVNFSWGLEKTLEEGRDPFFFVRGVMREADLALVNLETTVATNGSPQTKTHVFRSPPEVLHWLTNAGVDVVSLANNHAMDYGAEALLEMREHLRQYGIRFAGAGKNWEEAIQPVIVTQKGMTVGIVCAGFQKPEHLVATEKRPGTAGLRWKKIVPMVKKLRREVDYLIFFVHWGWEYVVSPLEKEQVSNAYAVIEAGADVIVGHHPHILQAIEVYRGRPILYSVGNFVFPQWNIAQARPALAVVLDVSKGKNGIEKRVYLLPLYRLSHTLQVVIASGQEVHEVWELVHQRSLERGKTWRLVPEKQSWVPFWRLESSTP
ncbi:MAG: CapA family protein [Brevinematales bacterium]|nr:CapA family protein [Brevinematales bacterium]